jgi:hypothetical protein
MAKDDGLSFSMHGHAERFGQRLDDNVQIAVFNRTG